MIQQALRADPFKEQLCESLQREMLISRTVKIARHANVYTCGDQDEMVYFVESGQIKLLMLSAEGKECLLAIHSAGDIFGELCLSGLGARLETATAMEETILKKIPSSQFLACLSRDSLLEGFVRYLAVRIADQQQVIANLVTVDSEQRLGKTLLQLAHALGNKNQQSTRIELKISHEELSEMVGTTRPRISLFMQRFRNLGLIETNLDRFLVINEKKLTAYLAQIARASGRVRAGRNDSFQNHPTIRQKSIPKSAERQTHSSPKSLTMGLYNIIEDTPMPTWSPPNQNRWTDSSGAAR
jgi:CRP/FNR family cyclic AMP-dependent transcriptional regulator